MSRHAGRNLLTRLAAHRSGAAAIWVALSLPPLLGAAAVALNVGEAALARQGVQMAADLAAQGGAISFARDGDYQVAANAAADLAELNGITGGGERVWNAASKTLTSGAITVALGTGVTDPTRTAISVDTSRALPVAFASLLSASATRTITANSTAEVWTPGGGGGGGGPGGGAGGGACVLATNPTLASAIKVDNMGGISGATCGIHANSNAAGTGTNAAIYLNSGTLSGSVIGTPGKVCLSNSGSNTVSPTIPNNSCASPASAVQADPFASLTVPSPSQPSGCAVNAAYGACCIPPITGTVGSYNSAQTNVVNASYTAWQATPRTFSAAGGGVFCGNTTIGGNGAADQFEPGIYYVVNGNLTFNNSNVTLANGVSFVLIGKAGGNPGAFSWTNYSNTYVMSAPATGPTAGILFWQTCPASGLAGTSTMAGGSTLSMSGSYYTPCGPLNMTNNIQMNASAGATMRVVANSIYVAGSARINAAGGAVAATPASVALVR